MPALVLPRSAAAFMVAAALLHSSLAAQQTAHARYVVHVPRPHAFPLATAQRTAPLVVAENDYPGVLRAAADLRADIERVTGRAPAIVHETDGRNADVVLIGTIGKSELIDRLIRSGKIDVSPIRGRWETFLVQPVERPMPGIERALVIAGSDKRGTIYGIYDLSAQIGVSPWYWWADVPVEHHGELHVLAGAHTSGTPAVKYRGFFINDEAPALSGWTHEKFGGFNHQFYEKVFELLLRMKGNYLWPAMWGNAFNDDDTLNARLADEYGVVMGTSHHEPMLRAQQEWKRYGTGAWNYETNAAALQKFWRNGIRNMGTHESIVTIGMRGDGDMPMSEQSDIALLERIVADQRRIIGEVTGKDAAQTPQLWALYKEVQDYYDRGMRVPDDVTLLFADDNWGNIRRLPAPGAAPRPGGYGIYYHFDYVGGPRNYKWLNTNQIERVWEQMHLAWAHRVDRIWIVNVGDVKPMEFPLEFFLDYAWNPAAMPVARLADYARRWAERQFGSAHATAIGEMLASYTKFNSRRKPELLSAETYSLENYREADRVVGEYNALAARAARLYQQLPPEYQDAFYQLILFPIQASANLNELYVTVAKNRAYAQRGDARANSLADKAAELFARDARLSAYFNDTLADGKWRHMMDQTHIGYTSWQQPDSNAMPEVMRIAGPSAPTTSTASADVTARPAYESERGPFLETAGYVAMEAEHYARAVTAAPFEWVRIPDLGRTLSAMTAFPVTRRVASPGGASPRLEFDVQLATHDSISILAYVSPTLDFDGDNALRYGISIDDGPVQAVNVLADTTLRAWERAVADNIRIGVSRHALTRAGTHVVKFWLMDPGVVLQRIVIDAGGLQPSYLGPPESARGAARISGRIERSR